VNSEGRESELGQEVEDVLEIIEEPKKEIIFDINIVSLSSLIAVLNENNYDFLIIEPSEEAISISFRKDTVEKEVRYIKYPIYTEILLKAKNIAKLNIEETGKEQI